MPWTGVVDYVRERIYNFYDVNTDVNTSKHLIDTWGSALVISGYSKYGTHRPKPDAKTVPTHVCNISAVVTIRQAAG